MVSGLGMYETFRFGDHSQSGLAIIHIIVYVDQTYSRYGVVRHHQKGPWSSDDEADDVNHRMNSNEHRVLA